MTQRPDPVPDPRTQRAGRCGVTRMVGDTEFVCIAKVHGDPPRPGRGHRSVQPHPYYPRSERHYFVRRWPNRGGDT